MWRDRLRPRLKALLPRALRRGLRACLHYTQRVGRWPIILWQVRGDGWSDRWTLIRSAFASIVLSLRTPLQWQDPVLLADARVHVPGVGRFMLRAHSDDLWHVLPWREQGVFEAIAALLRAGDTFVDAGANIGVYTVLASQRVGAGGRVVAVEMMPDTAARLERHIRLNRLDNVTLVRKALDRTGGLAVTAQVEAGKYGKARLVDAAAADGPAARVTVSTVTLDESVPHTGPVRLMKMDLEGAELGALQGASALLSRLDHLIYEAWGNAAAGLEPVDALLIGLGFSIRAIDGNNRLASRPRT